MLRSLHRLSRHESFPTNKTRNHHANKLRGVFCRIFRMHSTRYKAKQLTSADCDCSTRDHLRPVVRVVGPRLTTCIELGALAARKGSGFVLFLGNHIRMCSHSGHVARDRQFATRRLCKAASLPTHRQKHVASVSSALLN